MTAPPKLAGRIQRNAFAILVGMVGLAIVLIGLRLVRRQADEIRDRALAHLAAVADLKVALVSDWIGERRGDAVVASRGAYLATAVHDWLEAGAPAGPARDQLRDRLDLIRSSYQYSEILLLDPAGRFVLTTGSSQTVAAEVRNATAEAVRLKTPQFSPLYREGGQAANPVRLDLLSPLLLEDARGAHVAGLLVMRIDPGDYLYPALGSWPTFTETGEVTLSRHEGDSVVYLNPLRGRALALSLKQPDDRDRLPEASTAAGTARVVEGVDYQGKPVFAAIRAVPGTDWLLVAKIDTAEISDPVRLRIVEYMALMTALLASAFVVLRARWGRRAQRELLESEERLRRSEHEHRSVITNMTDAYYQGNLDGTIRRVNPAAVRLLGYRDAAELVGKNMARDVFVDPREREALLATLLETRTPSLFRARFRHVDGRSLIVEGNVRLVTAEDGTPEALEGLFRDMTARIQAEEALRASEAALAEAQRVAGLGGWEWDPVTNQVTWSAELYRIFALDPTAYTPKVDGYMELVHPDEREAIGALLRDLRTRGGSHTVDHRTILPDGSVRHLQVRVQTDVDLAGRPTRMFGTTQDITQRKEAEDALRAAKEAAEAATRAKTRLAELGQMVSDSSTRFISLEPSMIDDGINETLHECARSVHADGGYVFRYSADLQTFSMTHVWHGERLRSDPATLQGLPVSAMPWWMAQLLNGHPVMVASVADLPPEASVERGILESQGVHSVVDVPMMVGGDVIGLIGFSCADQGRAWSSDELLLLQMLSQTVSNALERKASDEALRTAREAAEAAARAKSTFLANMSHEIRTPLNAILGLSRLTLRTQLDARQRDYVEKIQSAANALLAVINDVLDYSKIEAGRLSLEAVPFTVQPILDTVASLVGLTAEEKGLTLQLRNGDDVPATLVGDPLRVSQVLINLVANAVKFTERGEVVVTTKVVRRDAGHATLRFSVRDTGIGLSSEQQRGLFQSFNQADSSTTRRYGGSGLGLAISKQLVQMMGGEIDVTSALGEGSTFGFTVSFPLPPAAPAGLVGHAMERRAAPLEGVRVLVAEDNEVNRVVAREMLESLGVVVDLAHDGLEAVALASSSGVHHDAVLMDLQMPGLDGYEAARRIRANPATARLPIIAMTAHAFASERMRCLEAGMNDHVAKPVDPDQLATVLAHWVGRSPSGTDRSVPRVAAGVARNRRSDGARPAIDFPSALARVGGGRALLLRLLEEFAADCLSAPGQIRAALERGDLDAARRQAHTLKGTAGNLSVTKVYAATVAVEKAIRAGNADRAGTLLEPLESALGLAVQAVRALRAEESGTGVEAQDHQNGARHGYPGDAREDGVAREWETANE
jgi:two-component system, sensor histidine kinase and response regulator